nr:MAG TPA: hypothetical protein [Caudoviricetes sp.]
MERFRRVHRSDMDGSNNSPEELRSVTESVQSGKWREPAY